jgi:hypothetical protein
LNRFEENPVRRAKPNIAAVSDKSQRFTTKPPVVSADGSIVERLVQARRRTPGPGRP